MSDQLALPLWLNPPPVPRCPERACPVRYARGEDRPCCADHDPANRDRAATDQAIPDWLLDDPGGAARTVRNALAPDPPGAA